MNRLSWTCILTLAFCSGAYCDWEPEVLLHRQGDRLGWFYEKVEGLGDWTGDGINDLAVTSRSNSLDTSVIDVWWGGQTLSADPDTTICLPDSLKGSRLKNAGDLTGDGVADFVMYTVVPNTYRVYMALWRGGRGHVELLQLIRVDFTHFAIPGDISGDGIPDLVLGSYNDSRIMVYLGTPTGYEGPVETLEGVGYHLGGGLIAGADMDGDGWGDFACYFDEWDTTFALFHPQPGNYLENYELFHGYFAGTMVPQAYQTGRPALILLRDREYLTPVDFHVHLGSPELDTIPDATLTLGDLFWSSVPACAGDVNGDGWGDWLAGSHDNYGYLGAFALFLGGPWISDYTYWHGGFNGYGGEGKHLNGVGDINGDGLDDFAVICAYDTTGSGQYGQIVVIAGDEEWQLAVRDRSDSPLERLVRISAFPNPAREQARIEVLGMPPGTATVEVWNVLGQRVWRNEVQVSSGRVDTVWQMQDQRGLSVAAGIYFVQVLQRGVSLARHKILVTR